MVFWVSSFFDFLDELRPFMVDMLKESVENPQAFILVDFLMQKTITISSLDGLPALNMQAWFDFIISRFILAEI